MSNTKDDLPILLTPSRPESPTVLREFIKSYISEGVGSLNVELRSLDLRGKSDKQLHQENNTTQFQHIVKVFYEHLRGDVGNSSRYKYLMIGKSESIGIGFNYVSEIFTHNGTGPPFSVDPCARLLIRTNTVSEVEAMVDPEVEPYFANVFSQIDQTYSALGGLSNGDWTPLADQAKGYALLGMQHAFNTMASLDEDRILLNKVVCEINNKLKKYN